MPSSSYSVVRIAEVRVEQNTRVRCSVGAGEADVAVAERVSALTRALIPADLPSGVYSTGASDRHLDADGVELRATNVLTSMQREELMTEQLS